MNTTQCLENILSKIDSMFKTVGEKKVALRTLPSLVNTEFQVKMH